MVRMGRRKKKCIFNSKILPSGLIFIFVIKYKIFISDNT